MVLSDLAPGDDTTYRSDGVSASGYRPLRAREYLTAREPWSARSGIVAAALATAGAVVVGVCWYGGSDLRTAEDQAPWLIGSVIGTAVFALGGVLWVIAGFRSVRHGMRQLAADKREFALGGRITGSRDHAPASGHAGLVIASGMVRTHRPDCLLVLGKQVRAVGPADDGLEGCGVCLP
ncbi:MAG TPA: hypothetical protein VNC22_21150 [Sporichthya sp.]|nr:hypothetical protein [Sporichthya sp.]